MEKQTVKFEGKNFVLLQKPYISDNGETYEALAVVEGNESEEVVVFWNICEFLGEQPAEEDEMCDWEQVARVMFL